MALTLSACPAPFLDVRDFPSTGGYVAGRACSNLTSSLTCCLPCPLSQWIFSDGFEDRIEAAGWVNVPALACQAFLLITYAVLPRKYSQRHYLSIGLCCALALVELACIIPLGTKPQQCLNAITPNDLQTSMSCGWTGALIESGGTATVVWILLRTVWTHLRVVWDLQPKRFIWIAHILGWGLPALFLAISLPIAGVSYQIGPTCVTNRHNGILTWFGWLLAFACLAFALQFATTAFCLLIWARGLRAPRRSQSSSTTRTSGSGETGPGSISTSLPSPRFPDKHGIGDSQDLRQASVLDGRLARKRVLNIVRLQWRSIVLSVVVAIAMAYLGAAYVALGHSQDNSSKPSGHEWGECLALSGGDKNKCLPLAKKLGAHETVVISSLFMGSLVGLVTFALMARRTMFVGWWQLLRNPRGIIRTSDAEEIVNVEPGRITRSKPDSAIDEEKSVGMDPAANTCVAPIVAPEPGDVNKRHETTTLFDDEDDEGVLEGGDSDEDDGRIDEVMGPIR